jgi:hypothetical protein
MLVPKEQASKVLEEKILAKVYQETLEISKFYIDKQFTPILFQEIADFVKCRLQELILQEGVDIKIPRLGLSFDKGVLIIKWYDENMEQLPQIKTQIIGLLYEILLRKDDF